MIRSPTEVAPASSLRFFGYSSGSRFINIKGLKQATTASKIHSEIPAATSSMTDSEPTTVTCELEKVTAA